MTTSDTSFVPVFLALVGTGMVGLQWYSSRSLDYNCAVWYVLLDYLSTFSSLLVEYMKLLI